MAAAALLVRAFVRFVAEGAGTPARVAPTERLAVGGLAFVHGYEKPTLARRYGVDYDAYRRRVPAWIPRRPGPS